jgi:hypothetical protein
MSLQKALLTQFGTTATYWKITGTSIAYVAELAIINLGGYADVDAKNTKLDCVPRNFRITGTDFAKYFSNSNMSSQDERDLGYAYIKENIEEFKDATNI